MVNGFEYEKFPNENFDQTRKFNIRSPIGKFFIMKGELSDSDSTDNLLDEILPKFLQSSQKQKPNFFPSPQFPPFGPPMMPPPFFFPLGPPMMPHMIPPPHLNFPPTILSPEQIENQQNLPKFNGDFDGAVVVEKFIAVPAGDKGEKQNQPAIKPLSKDKFFDKSESFEGTTKIKPNWINGGKIFNCPCEPFAVQKEWSRIRKCIKRCSADQQ